MTMKELVDRYRAGDRHHKLVNNLVEWAITLLDEDRLTGEALTKLGFRQISTAMYEYGQIMVDDGNVYYKGTSMLDVTNIGRLKALMIATK